MSNTLPSDHRKGCQCQTCVPYRPYPLEGTFDNQQTGQREFYHRGTLVESLVAAAIGTRRQYGGLSGDIYPWGKYPDVPRPPSHADAAQGGVTTTPDGSIAYRHVPIVEEKQK